AASAFAGSPQLLAEPGAPVSQAELESFVARHAYWIGEWARFAGEDAIADQVRFEREWSELRDYARSHGVRLVGDVPIYVSGGGADRGGPPRPLAPRSRRRALQDGRARARHPAGDRRGSRLDHSCRRRAPRRARAPGHGRAALGVRPGPRQPARAREPPSEAG